MCGREQWLWRMIRCWRKSIIKLCGQKQWNGGNEKDGSKAA